MKKPRIVSILEPVLLLAATLMPGRAAAQQTVTDYLAVETIAAHGSVAHTNWFTLVGYAAASGCPTSTASSQPRTLFTIPHDEQGKDQMALLTAALLAGRSVQVTYDPEVLLGGYCQAIAIFLK